jgi:hypothetical protein
VSIRSELATGEYGGERVKYTPEEIDLAAKVAWHVLHDGDLHRERARFMEAQKQEDLVVALAKQIENEIAAFAKEHQGSVSVHVVTRAIEIVGKELSQIPNLG